MASGQNLMGKWTGYFTPSSDIENRVFSYEMEITENANHQLIVKTFSKLSNDFSAKALANGLYSPNTGLVSIQENHFDELKMNGNLQACLMTNYLTYKNLRGHEVIEGTYTSSNIYTKKDCGGGTVYLEKTIPLVQLVKAEKAASKTITNKKVVKEETLVIKEEAKTNSAIKINSADIIVGNNSIPNNTNNNKNRNQKTVVNIASNNKAIDKLPTNKNNEATAAKTSTATATTISTSPATAGSFVLKGSVSINNSSNKTVNTAVTNAAVSKLPPTPIQKEVAIANAPQINNLNTKETMNEENEAPIESNIESPNDIIDNVNIKQGNSFQSIPWVLVGRVNKLVKKITTSSPKFSIDLYDNGTIDNDTIIVYDNKQLIVNRKRLSYKAIHVDFTFTNNIREHEVIIVAHNMGQVPPNTALLVLKDGNSRQELYITSTNKMNAKLIIEYSPPN
jgi:hypothetical protein